MFLIPKTTYKRKNLHKKGWGIFAVRDIPAGTVIGDYTGTLIPSDTADERKDGLYDMAGGLKYDILANPKKEGIQLVNHSCANNCDMYPYQGHMLYFALRKIFAGEELTVNYALSTIDDDMPCDIHACHCATKLCKGTMHDNWKSYKTWETLLKKNFGVWYHKIPGKYGDELKPLGKYPKKIIINKKTIYKFNIFGSEAKAPVVSSEIVLPTIYKIEEKIRQTGRQLFFPKAHLVVYGVQEGILLSFRKSINS